MSENINNEKESRTFQEAIHEFTNRFNSNQVRNRFYGINYYQGNQQAHINGQEEHKVGTPIFWQLPTQQYKCNRADNSKLQQTDCPQPSTSTKYRSTGTSMENDFPNKMFNSSELTERQKQILKDIDSNPHYKHLNDGSHATYIAYSVVESALNSDKETNSNGQNNTQAKKTVTESENIKNFKNEVDDIFVLPPNYLESIAVKPIKKSFNNYGLGRDPRNAYCKRFENMITASRISASMAMRPCFLQHNSNPPVPSNVIGVFNNPIANSTVNHSCTSIPYPYKV